MRSTNWWTSYWPSAGSHNLRVECRQLAGHGYVLQLHVFRQAVLAVRQLGLALDQRRQIAAGSRGDAEAVAADEAARQFLFAVGDLRQRCRLDLPAIGCIVAAHD